MRHSPLSTDDAIDLVQRVDPAFRPVWEGRPPQEQAALARYFLPHNSEKPVIGPTRPRLIKWYAPFAHQSSFPTGHRYCINVFTGCAHRCEYCYAVSYSPAQASPKRDFEGLLARDLEDLDRFDVPPAPVHLSNSTDPFQLLEERYGHTRLALEQILAHRHRFTSVVILTKNPMLPVRKGYLDLFRGLMELKADHPRRPMFHQRGIPAFCIEVSLTFWRDEARQAYDRCAPSVQDRIAGVEALRQAGIPVVLRIDPLFPRSPLSDTKLSDLGLAEAQTIEDLENLVRFAKDLRACHVVYSPVKVVKPHGSKLCGVMLAMRRAYELMAQPKKLIWRGGSWRLPHEIAQERIVTPFLDICHRHNVQAKFCMTNLIQTP